MRLYRNNCVKGKIAGEDAYIKDLRIFKNISLKDIVIIDNSILSFALQLDNGIPILPFYDNKSDNELMDLVKYMKILVKADDIRKENKKYIRYTFDPETSILDESQLSLIDSSDIQSGSGSDNENEQNNRTFDFEKLFKEYKDQLKWK